MSVATMALLVAFPATMAYAAASDLVSMTISNRLCFTVVAIFAVCVCALQLDWTTIGWHLAAGGAVLLVTFSLFAAGWIGGGDAKLAAVTALWFGFDSLLPYLALAGVAGGILTLAILRLRTQPLPAFVENWSWLKRLHCAKEGVPYGIALAFSALMILPDTAIWRAAIGV